MYQGNTVLSTAFNHYILSEKNEHIATLKLDLNKKLGHQAVKIAVNQKYIIQYI